MAFVTTLEKLRKRRACQDRYDYLVGALGADYSDDRPISVSKILETNGIEDALWAFRACDLDKEEEKALGLYLCDIAEHVLHVYEKQYPDDSRPRDVIGAKRRWLNGEIDYRELAAARAAVWAAARAADWDAAWDAARCAAWAADWDADWDATRCAAWAAVGAAARAAEREWQAEKLRKLLEDSE